MKNICKLFFGGVVGLLMFAAVLPASAKPPQTEDQLLADLNSPSEKVAYAALQNLEKLYPTDPNILPPIKKLLTDARPTVREKAARVLGALHADVSKDDLKNISAMLDSADKTEITEALKALRGLKAQSTIPKIIPLLQHADPFVKRDACRTLAVIGDKSVIKDIEPLQSDPDAKVQKDASDAIVALKAK
jgi:HEAT repeat protein